MNTPTVIKVLTCAVVGPHPPLPSLHHHHHHSVRTPSTALQRPSWPHCVRQLCRHTVNESVNMCGVCVVCVWGGDVCMCVMCACDVCVGVCMTCYYVLMHEVLVACKYQKWLLGN